jgi:uncharacterized protein with PIN domain
METAQQDRTTLMPPDSRRKGFASPIAKPSPHARNAGALRLTESGEGANTGPDTAFVGDRTVGGLIRWLRLMGFDAEAVGDFKAGGILSTPPPGVWLLTRMTRLDPGAGGEHLLRITADRPREQFREVALALRLQPSDLRPFSRCVRCNQRLEPVDRQTARHRVPEYVWLQHTVFSRCSACDRTYWRGSHRDKTLALIRRLMP